MSSAADDGVMRNPVDLSCWKQVNKKWTDLRLRRIMLGLVLQWMDLIHLETTTLIVVGLL